MIYNVEEKNDSLYMSATFIDTLFKLSSYHKAKLIDGSLILSRKDSVFWKMNILSILNDSLRWRHLSSKDDYTSLMSEISNIRTNQDTSEVYLKPTKVEFKRILSLNKMGWNRAYIKTK
jgi:hypothetical protein